MGKIKFDNDNFILYSTDSLDYITNDLESILEKSLELYKDIFNVRSFRKVQINYFDKLDDFRNYIYELRGEKESLPEYAKGTFDMGMINAYIEPNIIEGTPLYNHRRYNASHELFHIMYQELVWENNGWDRIVWFDEGMAEFFSGEYTYEIGDGFNKWFNDVKASTKKIFDINTLSHGEGFMTDEYNGYSLSLLAVKYLYDTLGKDEFIKLIHDNNRIKEIGKNVIELAFNYYK